MKSMQLAGFLLSLVVISDVAALSEAEKRQFRQQHEQEYQSGSRQHRVPLEEMKRKKKERFANNPAVRDCIDRAASPPELGACIDAARRR
jgi:hypothetical protein